LTALVVGTIVAVIIALVVFDARRRAARVRVPAVVTPGELGLDDLPSGGVLLQFSAPASLPCRVSLNRLAAVAAPSQGRVRVIEMQAYRRTYLTERLGVRSTPTIYFVGSDGVVRWCWSRAPERWELLELLGSVQAPAPAALR
jgi:hypothetical protein